MSKPTIVIKTGPMRPASLFRRAQTPTAANERNKTEKKNRQQKRTSEEKWKRKKNS